MRAIPYSKLLESEYYLILRTITEYIKTKFIGVAVEGMSKPTIKNQWQDANYSQRMLELINSITRDTKTRFDAERLAKLIKKIVLKTDKWQYGKFKSSADYGFGFDISDMPEFKAYKPFINAIIQKNISLIENLRDDTLYRLELSLRTAVEQGKSIRQVTEDLVEVGQHTRRRAALIARNEIKNITAKLSEKRSVNAGFDIYEWLTAEDERVRGNPRGRYPKAIPSHYIMSGLYCKYSDDTVYSPDKIHWYKRTSKMPKGKPGEEINCRCVARPED